MAFKFNAYTADIETLIPYGPEAIAAFHSYCFEWIDNLHFLRPPEDLIGDDGKRAALEKAVRARFLQDGWKGTGDLALLWLPPFVFEDTSKTEGQILWHVKQTEDGISWILSPVPLPFLE